MRLIEAVLKKATIEDMDYLKYFFWRLFFYSYFKDRRNVSEIIFVHILLFYTL